MIVIQGLGPSKKIPDILLNRFKCNLLLNSKRCTANRYPTGIDLVRDIGAAESNDDEQKKSLYPMLKQLGIETEGRTHSFSLSSDSVIKYIKLGAINRNLSVQYCHYLSDLCRQADPKDLDHYTARVTNLTQYILKTHKDLPLSVKLQLLADSANTSETFCLLVCDKLLDEQNLWQNIEPGILTQLLSASYRFKSWDLASRILQRCPPDKGFHWPAFDVLITSMSDALLNSGDSSREGFKQSLLDHLQKLFNFTRERRIQFVTKQPELLFQCLERMMQDVYKRPIIKMTGRCTHCNTHIPTYDNEEVLHINNSIRKVLDEQHMGNLTIYSSKSDMIKFYQFLEDLHKVDKRPIDCVIDGLNLAYKNSIGHIYKKVKHSADFEKTVKRHDKRFQVQVLINAIICSNFLERFRKIVVIGKAHMQTWPGLMEFFKKNNIHFYASDNQAKDDLFMLYASTLSPKTVLVTNDFLRDHLVLLQGNSRTQLERYIDTHQVWIDNRSLTAIWNTPFEKIPYADESCNHFHIPVIDYNKMDIIAQHEPPPHLNNKITMWLCCSAKKKSDTIMKSGSLSPCLDEETNDSNDQFSKAN